MRASGRPYLGREPIKPEALANVRFGANIGLESEIAPCPKSAITGSQPSRLIYPIGGIAL